MIHLNYNHLHYFWMVAREGSIARAAQRLHVAPQTISGQLRSLEEGLNAKLFARDGRNLVLTDTGRVVMGFASRMFQLGDQLKSVLDGGVISGPSQLAVGVAMVVPKLLAYRVLEPALEMQDDVQLSCHEAPLDTLIEELIEYRLDLVIADAPFPPTTQASAYCHHLGDSGISFFCDTPSVEHYRRGFPSSLNGAPMLLPSSNSALHASLWKWLREQKLEPRVVASFDDTALMNAFGEAGAGVFALPTVIERDALRRYRVSVVGRSPRVRESFYVISTERRLEHPAVTAITNRARSMLFGQEPQPDADRHSQQPNVSAGSK